MYQTSTVEIQVRHELFVHLGKVVIVPKLKLGRFNRPDSRFRVEGRDVVVEFDSEYHHLGTEALDRDKRKQLAYKKAGILMFRIRQGDLPTVNHRTDIRVARNATVHQIACATLRKLKRHFKMTLPHLAVYEAGGECWASAEAEKEIAQKKAAQAQRRAEKLARLAA